MNNKLFILLCAFSMTLVLIGCSKNVNHIIENDVPLSLENEFSDAINKMLVPQNYFFSQEYSFTSPGHWGEYTVKGTVVDERLVNALETRSDGGRTTGGIIRNNNTRSCNSASECENFNKDILLLSNLINISINTNKTDMLKILFDEHTCYDIGPSFPYRYCFTSTGNYSLQCSDEYCSENPSKCYISVPSEHNVFCFRNNNLVFYMTYGSDSNTHWFRDDDIIDVRNLTIAITTDYARKRSQNVSA